MAVRRLAAEQPESFAFTPANEEWAKGQIAKYPETRQASAVIPLLWKAQEQHGGWLPEPAIRAVADMLGMAYIRVLEVATFYTMFSLEPVGRHLVQLCGTTPCMLRGANKLKAVCERVIGPQHHVTADGALSWMEVECLGACANAPMAQVNYDYYEDLDPDKFEALLERFRSGTAPAPGSQTGRAGSAPAGDLTSLTDESLFDGSCIGGWRKRFAPKEEPVPEAPEAEASSVPSERSDVDAKREPPIVESGAKATGNEQLRDPRAKA
jgi:NADH-quinone oxidoreductase subunit E